MLSSQILEYAPKGMLQPPCMAESISRSVWAVTLEGVSSSCETNSANLLSSERTCIANAPADNRTGCAIESPANAFLLLAINGPATEQELHQLVNSLIPAAEYKRKELKD